MKEISFSPERIAQIAEWLGKRAKKAADASGAPLTEAEAGKQARVGLEKAVDNRRKKSRKCKNSRNLDENTDTIFRKQRRCRRKKYKINDIVRND